MYRTTLPGIIVIYSQYYTGRVDTATMLSDAAGLRRQRGEKEREREREGERRASGDLGKSRIKPRAHDVLESCFVRGRRLGRRSSAMLRGEIRKFLGEQQQRVEE